MEDALFEKGITLKQEHSLHSFIVDLDDNVISEIFSRAELSELRKYQVKDFEDIPSAITEFLSEIRSDSLSDFKSSLATLFGCWEDPEYYLYADDLEWIW